MKIFFILFSVPTLLYAQNSKSFRIIGNSSFYNNQNLVIQAGVFPNTYKYNDFNFENDKVDTSNNPYKLVQVQNKQFTINGFQKYPHPFSVSYYDAEKNMGNNSNFFFIDSGTVNIEINNLLTNKNLGNRLNSKSNKEYQHLKKLYSNSVDTLSGIIHNLKAKQKTMQKYITQNPNSYVALWDMVIDYAINKIYKNDYDKKSLLKNAQLLSPKIKKTNTYQALVKNINQDLKLAINKKLPNASLALENDINTIVKKNQFTLIDFWFSFCKPCIAQLPSLKKTYDLYHDKHFEIIAISVDQKADEGNWQKIINKFNLEWKQYLDTNELLSQKYNITKFPSNFLMDKNGKIIEKDISPEDLESFLQKNLN